MTRGVLIALEGIDGSGTTSQAEWLSTRLQQSGHPTLLTAEPSTRPIGKLIREALAGRIHLNHQVLAMLYAADRLDHLAVEIEPRLASGRTVITDRYLLSSYAYQSVDDSLAWVEALNARAKRPDASILLRVSPEIAAQRRAVRGGAEELFDSRLHQIAEAYDQVFALDSVGPTYVLDATRDFEAVAADLWRLACDLIARRGDKA